MLSETISHLMIIHRCMIMNVEVKSADVVVIGGGARGCSIALFLARAGVGVVLVERRFLSSMVSSANGAQVNVSAKKPDYYTRMSLRSARMYPDFLASLDVDIFLQQEGILFATIDPEQMSIHQQRVQELKQMPDLPVQLLDGLVVHKSQHKLR